ncbi:hypothetical protein PCC7424_1607 [Gloeothece citriformis PCC 7424]|uniref:Uncharacterized protein n=1 Tax=Gloeothece citriformis (strain PCC 7424) TaxID=65393 RepID=B7K9S8_GLOC7|nr:hypothetical protein [Gloeothece citriformis]ACK70046.1 hypothetical protein PCC7424_1607 [Gloeothece citriformis PCC 7424]
MSKNPLLFILIFTSITLGFLTLIKGIQGQNLNLPTRAKVIGMVNGDLACYVDLVDDNGQEYLGIYAIFEICEQQETFLNKRVKLSYNEESFNDCESIEPCGKTKRVKAITEMTVIAQ